MFGCQQILINPNNELRAILEFICCESNKLHNCGTYYIGQLYFKTGKIPGKFDLQRLMTSNRHFQAMYSQAAQQCLATVAESFRSFVGLLRGISKGTVTQKPKLPNYRKPGLNIVTYLKQVIKLKEAGLRFPLGRLVTTWFGVDSFYLHKPSNLDFSKIREYRILPRNGAFYLELIYNVESVQADVDTNNVLGIDPGLNNWLTCVSNVGTSFIVDGLHLKSLNQWYNKRVARLKENQPQGFWSNQLARITEKRNRQMRDAVNKAARIVVNHCIKQRIGTVVFGWNKGQRQNINLGSKTNQSFVQIPTAKLKSRIAQLCEQYGIQFIETEESYTSKASFLDLDELPTFGEKPEGWKESGKRVKRGLYRTKDGFRINSDANGAANILRKVAAKLGFNLNGVSRGSLARPELVV